MTAEADRISTARGNRPLGIVWLLLGLATYWYASLAVLGALDVRRVFPLVMGLMMGSPALVMALVATLMPLPPILGYIAIRYWVLPVRPQGWRNGLVLPLITLPCMVLACGVSGFLASLLTAPLRFLSIPCDQALLYLLTGALAGVFLYGIERLLTRLVFGPEAAAELRPALCGAHAAGIAVILLAQYLPSIVGIYFFHAAISQTWAKWLVLAIVLCGQIVHLWMAWRAWGGGSRLATGVRGVAAGLVLAFVAMSLIGTAARVPTSPGPLEALSWPLSHFLGWPKP